jgi:S1-C subfamily serine protease
LAIPAGTGVIVEEILPSSPAVGSGLRARDVILEVGSEPVSNPQQFADVLGTYGDGQILRLRIRRGHAWVFIAFTIN